MFNWLKKDPLKKLEKEYKFKSEEALEVGRGKYGDLKLHAKLVAELKELKDKIVELSKKK